MKFKELIKMIRKKQIVQLIIKHDNSDRSKFASISNYVFNIDDINLIEFVDELYDFKVMTVFTEYDKNLKDNKIVIEVQENIKKIDHVSTYFYGIDFKKVQLYCKIEYLKSIYIAKHIRKIFNVKIKIDNEKYYSVKSLNFEDELLTIVVDCEKLQYVKDHNSNTYSQEVVAEDRFTLTIKFDDVEFSYFFEDTSEDELEKGIF